MTCKPTGACYVTRKERLQELDVASRGRENFFAMGRQLLVKKFLSYGRMN